MLCLTLYVLSGYEILGYRFCNGKAYPESLTALMVYTLPMLIDYNLEPYS